MEIFMDKASTGIDVGKEAHWAHVLDASGRKLLSRKVENDEADLSPSSSTKPSPSLRRLSGPSTSQAAGQHYSCWHFCGSEDRESSIHPRSRRRPSSRCLFVESPTPTPETPTSSLIKLA